MVFYVAFNRILLIVKILAVCGNNCIMQSSRTLVESLVEYGSEFVSTGFVCKGNC